MRNRSNAKQDAIPLTSRRRRENLSRQAVTIQAIAYASPAGSSLSRSILYRRRSRGRLRSTRPRAPFRGLDFQVALLAPLRRGFLLRRDSRPISLQPSELHFGLRLV